MAEPRFRPGDRVRFSVAIVPWAHIDAFMNDQPKNDRYIRARIEAQVDSVQGTDVLVQVLTRTGDWLECLVPEDHCEAVGTVDNTVL